jgi:cell wall assembly regulator SMI1
MKEIWQRIENWLGENYPEGLEMLNVGASDDLIQATEQFLGIEFPEDVKDFYRVHNGGRYELALINGRELLSLEEIQSQWKIWQELTVGGEFEENEGEPEKEISKDWYNIKWIPITHNGGGDHDCLDFAPTEDGNYGQIIQMWHDWEKRSLEAKSFREWIEKFADELEAGLYKYSEEYGVSREIE